MDDIIYSTEVLFSILGIVKYDSLNDVEDLRWMFHIYSVDVEQIKPLIGKLLTTRDADVKFSIISINTDECDSSKSFLTVEMD